MNCARFVSISYIIVLSLLSNWNVSIQVGKLIEVPHTIITYFRAWQASYKISKQYPFYSVINVEFFSQNIHFKIKKIATQLFKITQSEQCNNIHRIASENFVKNRWFIIRNTTNSHLRTIKYIKNNNSETNKFQCAHNLSTHDSRARFIHNNTWAVLQPAFG